MLRRLFASLVIRPLALSGFLSGILMGAALLWMLTAAWIELAPTTVLPDAYGVGVSSQAALDNCNFADVLVLGDSKILGALDRLSMPFSVLNFAGGGDTPAVDYFRTKSIVHCERLPKLVVLSYSPIDLRHFSPFLINNLLLNRLLPVDDLLEIAGQVAIVDGGSSLATLPVDDVPELVKAVAQLPFPLRTLLYRTDFPPLYWASIQASLKMGISRRWQVNHWVGEEVLHPHGHDSSLPGRESQAVFFDAAIGSLPRSHVIESYYLRLVDRFAERGVPVLIATIPVNEPTDRAIPQHIKDEISAFLRRLPGRHGNVTVLAPVWAVWPSTSFADRVGHVNARGQAQITRLMNRCIASLLHSSDHLGPTDCTMDYDAL